jgi:hypothetical protein
MSSYFIKRGAPAERGCIDEEALRRMVAEERLTQDDLVWIDGRTPGWVRAKAVPGLFPEPAPLPQAAQPAVVEQKSLRKPKPSQRHVGGKLLLLLILVLIGGVSAFWLPRFYAGRMFVPRATPPEPTAATNDLAAAGDTRDWSPELSNLSRLLATAKLGPAREMLQGLQAAGCASPELVPLTEQLRALEADHAYMQAQGAALGRGQLELAAVDPLVAATRRLHLMPALRRQVEEILIEPGVEAAQVSQSMAVGLAMGNSNVVAHAVAWVVGAPTEQVVIAPFWTVLGRLSESGQPRVAEALCRALLRAAPRDPRLGLELAALLASQGRENEAIDALKKASKYASDEAKKEAAADPRFTPLHGNRRFTRYLK